MVRRCVKCNRIIKNYGLYCPRCEKEVKERIEKEKEYKKRYRNSDFFERQKL
jgi:predicted amidophosphoribosyltransferase